LKTILGYGSGTWVSPERRALLKNKQWMIKVYCYLG
jgi:hypothetical protein